MKILRVIVAVGLVGLVPPTAAATINPAIVALKDWLLQKGPDGVDNGMRKSLTLKSPEHKPDEAEVSYSVLQSSAVARTLKFLSEYYLTYQGGLNDRQKDELYGQIQVYVMQLLRHRKYQGGWGWELRNGVPAELESDKFYTGAVATSEEYKMFTGLGNAFACESLVAAATVAAKRGDAANRTAWLEAAQGVGDFLCRLADPYEYYESRFGALCMVDEAGLPIRRPGLVFSHVSSAESLATEVPLQNLYAIVGLKALGEATGISSYTTAAGKIRDEMLPGLRDFNAAFYARFADKGSKKLSPNEYEDNAWHPLKTGQVGDDNIEYALSALWQFGGVSDLADLAKPFLNAPANKIADYDSSVSFTGYFKKMDGAWKHQMPYYDMVGFGLLGELRRSISPADYQRAYKVVVEDKVKAGRAAELASTMMDARLNPYWASTDEASESTLVSVAIGLSLMSIAPYEAAATSAAPKP